MDSPPPPSAPPPPSPTPPSAQPAKPRQRDNGIAVAGLITSLFGLILSIVVVGGLVGFIGIVMSVVGWRRSANLGGSGRGAALGGIFLGIMSMVASVGFAFVVADMLQGGPEIVRDGIATRSSNTEFPPQDDIVEVVCETTESGRLARTIVELRNNSPETSAYAVTVVWETDAQEEDLERLIRSDSVEPGTTVELTVIEPSGDAVAESCRVALIDRSSFVFLNE